MRRATPTIDAPRGPRTARCALCAAGRAPTPVADCTRTRKSTSTRVRKTHPRRRVTLTLTDGTLDRVSAECTGGGLHGLPRCPRSRRIADVRRQFSGRASGSVWRHGRRRGGAWSMAHGAAGRRGTHATRAGQWDARMGCGPPSTQGSTSALRRHAMCVSRAEQPRAE